MQIGISTASFFTQLQTEETLLPIAELGADRYEAFLSGPFEYETAFINDMYRRQKALGLRCTAVHALGSQFEPQLFSIADRQREAAEYVYQKVLEGAAKLQAPLYVMHGVFHLKRNVWQPSYERWGERLAQLCEMAASFGVKLTLENVHWCMYARSGLAGLFEPYLGNCGLGYTLDIKQAVQSGDLMEDYVNDMGKRLCNVHLCDVITQEGEMYTCLPGKGQVDFAALAKALASQNPQASITLEVYASDYRSMGDLKQSYQYLCAVFANYNKEINR